MKQELNDILREAHDGDGAWHFWVPDKRYKDIPDEDGQEGSKAPFDDSERQPPEIDAIEDAIDFVGSLPNSKSGRLIVDRHHFAIVDHRFREKYWLTLYRVGDRNHEGDEISSFPITPKGATVYLTGQQSEHWDHSVERWKKFGVPENG